MLYTIYYRKTFFWKKLIVTGHRYEKELNRMDFYLKDNSVLSLTHWDRYDMKLGVDWLIAKQHEERKLVDFDDSTKGS